MWPVPTRWALRPTMLFSGIDLQSQNFSNAIFIIYILVKHLFDSFKYSILKCLLPLESSFSREFGNILCKHLSFEKCWIYSFCGGAGHIMSTCIIPKQTGTNHVQVVFLVTTLVFNYRDYLIMECTTVLYLQASSCCVYHWYTNHTPDSCKKVFLSVTSSRFFCSSDFLQCLSVLFLDRMGNFTFTQGSSVHGVDEYSWEAFRNIDVLGDLLKRQEKLLGFYFCSWGGGGEWGNREINIKSCSDESVTVIVITNRFW